MHDLAFKQGDLIVATHGRSFYIMDDISTLEQMTDAIADEAPRTCSSRAISIASRLVAASAAVDAAVAARAQAVTPENAPVHPTGANPPTGVTVQYWLKTGGETVGLDFLDATGKTIRTYSSKVDSAATPAPAAGADEGGFGPPPQAQRVPNSKASTHSTGTSATPTPRHFPE